MMDINLIKESKTNKNGTEEDEATFTLNEVSRHNQVDDCWIIIHNMIYDVTTYLSLHPGGIPLILKCAGAFFSFFGIVFSKTVRSCSV